MNRNIIILGVIVAIVAVGAAVMMFPSLSVDGADKSNLDILGNGKIAENGTLNVKLSNSEGIALKDKEIHLTVKDANGSVVFEKSAKTFVNGVANIKMENVSSGEYEVSATFDGDKNHTAATASEKLVIGNPQDDSDDDNSTSTDDASSDDGSDDSSTQSSSSSSSQSSSSYNGYSPYNYYDGGSSYDDGGGQQSDGGNPTPDPVDGGGGESQTDSQT